MSPIGLVRRVSPYRRGALTCRDVVELLSDHIDGTLSIGRALHARRHLARCADCRQYLAQLRATLSVLGRLERRP